MTAANLQIVQHLKEEAGIPLPLPPQPKATPATKAKAKGRSQADPTPPGSPPAPDAKAATPRATTGTMGTEERGDPQEGSAKPAPAPEHLSRAEAAAEAKKALEGLALPQEYHRLGAKLKITR